MFDDKERGGCMSERRVRTRLSLSWRLWHPLRCTHHHTCPHITCHTCDACHMVPHALDSYAKWSPLSTIMQNGHHCAQFWPFFRIMTILKNVSTFWKMVIILKNVLHFAPFIHTHAVMIHVTLHAAWCTMHSRDMRDLHNSKQHSLPPFCEMKFISDTGRSFREMGIHFAKLTMHACPLLVCPSMLRCCAMRLPC